MANVKCNCIKEWTSDERRFREASLDLLCEIHSTLNYGFAWVPTAISGLLFWADASRATSITSNSDNQVAQINDLSGNNHHATQSVDANKPVSNGLLSFTTTPA